MSSSSPFRTNGRAVLLTAPLLAACCLLSAATGAAEEQLDIVAIVASADRDVSLVVDVRATAATPIRSEDFSVRAGEIPLPTRALPVISDLASIGIVVDASAADVTVQQAGLSGAQQAGLSGAANFLLQMPVEARTTVVADTRPPRVLAPPETGATDAVRALSAVEGRGERDTSEALTLVLRQLPDTPGRLRVVVLYTRGPDASGEAAADLAERLAEAHAVLAVIATGADTRYWSRVTTATGGVLVAAEPAAVMMAFDHVADALRARHVLTFPSPGELPTRVSVRVNTVDGPLTADAVVSPGQDGIGHVERPRSASKERGDGGLDLLSLLVLGVGALVVIAAAVLFMARRARSRHVAGPDVMLRGLDAGPGGATVPGETSGSEVQMIPMGEVSPEERRSEAAGAESRRSPAEERPPAAVESEEAAASAVQSTDGGRTGKSQAASAAAAVAAAEQRARAVAAAARSAAEAASAPHIRRAPRSK